MAKKKINDLTKEEIEDICDSYERCSKCPLDSKKSYCFLLGIDNTKLSKKYLNKKVEVKE